jgi:hypothetical protein
MAKRTVTARKAADLGRLIAQEFAIIRKKNAQLLLDVQSSVGRSLFRGGLLVQARAKEIITEKGHVKTGNLRRSINTQLTRSGPGGDRISAEVGTFVEYAPNVEALPDGGYLFPASEEAFPQVVALLARDGLLPALERWGQ